MDKKGNGRDMQKSQELFCRINIWVYIYIYPGYRGLYIYPCNLGKIFILNSEE